MLDYYYYLVLVRKLLHGCAGYRGARPCVHKCRQHVPIETREVSAWAQEVSPLHFSEERAEPEVRA